MTTVCISAGYRFILNYTASQGKLKDRSKDSKNVTKQLQLGVPARKQQQSQEDYTRYPHCSVFKVTTREITDDI
jgi:hypothetical protein